MPSLSFQWILCGLLPASAVACIACHYAGRRVGVYIFKPLTMLLALALALHPEASASGYRSLVVAGLVASLAGDVLLMLPRDRFAAGLASFLLAHLLYVAAFAPAAGLTHPGLLLVFAGAGAATYALLHARLGRMRLPVLVYVAALAAMAWQAGARWLELRETGALLAFLGAALFVVSDAALAWNRFRRPFRAAQAVVLGTYFPAQWLIALSAGVGEALLRGGPR
jgi:uncharacterized membrane protein YhhN